jgi:AAA15 family ATPase/GTPase
MNEQLIVKNFGPIKDATVDFKRVTVFIGPTGGGKSTLAKLAAVWRQSEFNVSHSSVKASLFSDYGIKSFFVKDSNISWKDDDGLSQIGLDFEIKNESKQEKALDRSVAQLRGDTKKMGDFIELAQKFLTEVNKLEPKEQSALPKNVLDIIAKPFYDMVSLTKPKYIISERIFVSALEYSWAGLMRDNIGLSKLILDFANDFSVARKDVSELTIPFLDATYLHISGRDFIKIANREEPLMLLEAASGIQSATPLLVLLEHLSRNTEQAQSFIIEEPELNLYPTAQRDLVYWLLEKCTQGDNDLTITTHSPYVLSALNLALYAGKVATLFPHQRQKVAKIIPDKYWLKADEFSAYHVAGGGVKSIFDTKTGLLSESQLDEVSGHFADIFDRLTDLRVPEKKAPAKAKPTKK